MRQPSLSKMALLNYGTLKMCCHKWEYSQTQRQSFSNMSCWDTFKYKQKVFFLWEAHAVNPVPNTVQVIWWKAQIQFFTNALRLRRVSQLCLFVHTVHVCCFHRISQEPHMLFKHHDFCLVLQCFCCTTELRKQQQQPGTESVPLSVIRVWQPIFWIGSGYHLLPLLYKTFFFFNDRYYDCISDCKSVSRTPFCFQ